MVEGKGEVCVCWSSEYSETEQCKDEPYDADQYGPV